MKIINKSKITNFLNFNVKLIVLSSLLFSQLSLSEIFLYQNNPDTSSINIAKADTSDTWYNPSYLYRKEITIDHTKVPNTDQTNFPVLVSFTDNALRTVANGGKVTNASGYDIIFVNQAGDTKLDHEIESYDTVYGTIVMWVKIPVLSHIAPDTVIYVYYGNSDITNSQENRTGVWDDGTNNNYKGVWHMKEDPSGTAPQIKDSTTNANNGTTSGDMTSGNSVSGKVDGAISFDGSNDFIYKTNNASLNFTTQFTLGMWVKSTTNVNGFLGKTCGGGGSQDHHYMLSHNGTSISVTIGDGDCATEVGNSDSLEYQWFLSGYENTWVSITATFNNGQLALYRNGTLIANKTSTITALKNNSSNFEIGRYPDYNGFYTNASMDEVRVSNISRSADWIKTEYNNQSSPSTFYSVSPEDPLSYWNYRKAITIDSSKVSGTSNLSNFPVLINLPLDNDLRDHARADGYDIIFVPSNISWSSGNQSSMLNYEIESYDSGTGSLQVWVKIPTLYSSNNSPTTTFYMYYGNDSASPNTTANIQRVWDDGGNNNFKGVWHLKESATGIAGDFKDSTVNGNNNINTFNEPIQATGKIGKGQSFNGSNNYIYTTDIDTLGNFNYSAWVKLNTLPSSSHLYMLFDKEVVGVLYPSVLMQINSTGTVTFGFFRDLSIAQTVTTADTLNIGTWYHLAGDYDGSKVRMYINGTLSREVYASGTPNNIDRPLMIGSTEKNDSPYCTNSLDGSIDEARISNIARTPDWISTEYNNQSTTPGVGNFLEPLSSEENPTPSALTQVTSVPTYTNTTTPAYTFNSTKAGSVTYSGDCSSSTTNAIVGDNTITSNTLSEGLHSNCTVKVITPQGFDSNTLNVNSFTVDVTNPTISGATDNAIYNTDKTITFSDNLTTPTATLNGTPFNSGDIVSQEGSYTLIVTDSANNFVTVHFTLDKTAPTASAGSDQTVSSLFTQTATATDNGSGIDASSYQWNKVSGPGTLTFGSANSLSTTISADTDGTYSVSFTASDNATNSIADIFTFTWDTSLPQVTGVNEGTSYNIDRTITFNEGIATLNSNPFNSGSIVSNEGNYTLIVTSIAGTTTLHFTIDKTNPNIPTASPPEGIYNTSQSVTLASDLYTTTYYTTDGSTPDSTQAIYTKPINIDVPDTQSITLKAISIDSAHNGSSILTQTYSFNKSAPQVSGVTNNTIYSNPPVISFNKGTATLDGQAFLSGSTVTTSGDHTLIITDLGGTTTIHFTISSPSFIPATKPNINSIKIEKQEDKINVTNIPQSIIQFTLSALNTFKDSSWTDINKIQETINKYFNPNTTFYLKFRTKQGAVSDTLTYQPSSSSTLNEGDIVKTPHNPDVYIIKYKNSKKYKRIVLSPQVFNSYQHLKWSNIKVIAQTQLDTFITSNLVQVKGDNSVYSLTPTGDTGKRQVLDTSKDYDKDGVYEINSTDKDSYVLVN